MTTTTDFSEYTVHAPGFMHEAIKHEFRGIKCLRAKLGVSGPCEHTIQAINEWLERELASIGLVKL